MALPYEQQFHFRDGTAVGTLEELKAKIETIGYQEFYHHVNSDKNDFANWVRYVLKQDRVADELRKVTSIVETVEIINDFLNPQQSDEPKTDNQSRIEQDVLGTPLAAALPTKDLPLVIEQVPTTSPSAAQSDARAESLDFKIIEEKISLGDASAPKDTKITGKVEEELFGPAANAAAQVAPAVEKPSQKAELDTTRMIVKDFMYGFVFGLIVGILLGKIVFF